MNTIRMRTYFAGFILMVCCANIIASSSDSILFLIPQPKKVEIRSNTFSFGNSFSVSAINTNEFYSLQLKDAVAKKFKTKLVDTSVAVNKIKLIKGGATDFGQLLSSEKIMLPFALGAEGYILSVSPQSIVIMANENAGVFYGVQTLIQLINANSKGNTIPCVVICDKPDMRMRGWQDDISRGPIPSMEFLKEQIRRMASFKLNTFTLYTEHVFKLRQHPAIAPRDGISEEEIKELIAFAKNYHVDIIGNFQSFGHFNNILKVPGYEHLGENEHALSPAKEESYKFLAEVFSEIVPAYDSKYFHINCDEVNLGKGPSGKMIDSMGVEGVYAYHINRIDSLLKPYNKRIMMWGDIAVHNPKIIQQLPKDVIIVSWGYAEMQSMEEDILPFVESGFEFLVAPGVSCWSRIYPDIERASINIYNYLRDGYKHGALGFINTTWDDSGQNLFNNNWCSLAWGADCGWNAPANAPVAESEKIRKSKVVSFNKSYNRIYYNTDKDITSLLTAISGLKYGPVKNSLSDGSIWNSLLPDYDIIPENYQRDNENLIRTIDSLFIEANKLRHSFNNRESEFELLTFALRQARLVVNKNLLGIQLKNYVQKDEMKDIRSFERDFAALADTIKALKPIYGKLWALENRNWWLDTVYSYYDSFAPNLDKLKGVCIIKASDDLIDGKREIRLRSAFNDLPVYFTTDGTPATLSSAKYTEPIYTNKDIHIQARVIDNGKMYDVQTDSLTFHQGIGALYKLNCKWDTKNVAYAARGELGLIDGRKGSKNNFSDGRWQGYLAGDIDIELDLREVTPLSKITMGFAQLMRYGILYPSQIEVSTSADGDNYTLVNTEVNTIDPNTEERSTHDFSIQLKGTTARYIKVVAKNSGLLPEWHHAKGTPSWLFADEIKVE